MPDLVEKFFREGLTNQEEQILSDSLFASEETAEKFANLAEEAYVRYGLPEPALPDRPPSGPQRSGFWGLGFLAILLGSSVLGTVLIKSSPPNPFRKLFVRTGSADPASLGSAGSFSENREGGGLKLQVIYVPGSSSAMELGTSEQTSIQAQVLPGSRQQDPLDGPRQEVPLPGKTALLAPKGPINLDLDPKATYSSVSVVVHLSHPSDLKVRVLDTRGLEITSLYQGPLGSGHWVFEWDGSLSGGRSASPGFYQIEVKVGAYIQRKSIQIR